MLRFIAPHHRIGSVSELSLDRLRELGLDALLLDVDCTLKRHAAEHFEPGVLEWLDEIRQGGIALCLLSNGMGKRIGRVAEQLQLPFVAKACKPLPLGCRRAMRMIGASPGRRV